MIPGIWTRSTSKKRKGRIARISRHKATRIAKGMEGTQRMMNRKDRWVRRHAVTSPGRRHLHSTCNIQHRIQRSTFIIPPPSSGIFVALPVRSYSRLLICLSCPPDSFYSSCLVLRKNRPERGVCPHFLRNLQGCQWFIIGRGVTRTRFPPS